jgi:hypothetical protein
MPDKFLKSRPWRFIVLRPFEQKIGALVIEEPRTGRTQEIAPATFITQSPGERMTRTKGEAVDAVAAIRAEHGADVVGDVYRAIA